MPMHLVNKKGTVFVHSPILPSAYFVLVTVPSLAIRILNSRFSASQYRTQIGSTLAQLIESEGKI